MKITRRDFIKATSALGISLGMPGWALARAGLDPSSDGGAPPVIWLQGQGCSGCSVSLLNSINTMSIQDLLLNTINLEYHPTLMAAAGSQAVKAAEDRRIKGDYVLVVEGAVPTAAGGQFCHAWDGRTFMDVVKSYGKNASHILAVGTCASHGGIPGGKPDATGARGVKDVLGTTATVVNIPGCPTHPDWIVGTVAHIISYNQAPALDTYGRPLLFFQNKVHARCPERSSPRARSLGEGGCLADLGCKGRETYSDCPVRKWNSSGPNQPGVNWCVEARNPCGGCTEHDYPDGKSPFYEK